MPQPAPLSILDLVCATEDGSVRQALDNARDLAAHAEQWGYRGKQAFAKIGCKWAS